MTDGAADSQVTGVAQGADIFASRVDYAIRSALGSKEELLRARTEKNKVIVHSVPEEGIPLTVGDSSETVYRLKYQAFCSWNESQQFVGIQYSKVALYVESVAEPVLRLEYVKDSRNEPVSHFHVHSHHQGLMEAMSRADKKSRAGMASSKPQVIHLPTGGHRYRPTVEDIMEMLVTDFGINAAKTWQEELGEGRALFKESQLAAAISDNPGRAVEVLRSMGYDVKWAGEEQEPSVREDRLRHY